MGFNDNGNSNIFEEKTGHVPLPTWRSWLVGRPLSTADAPNQAIGKLIGLAVFSSDALSSVAYGPQELMVVLAAAGVVGLRLSFPIVIAIVLLLAILTFSYEQTIHAYPGGGGAYIVSRDNLGELPALMAGTALLVDYILTVAVSISSGVAQIVSAFPTLYPYRVEISVGFILFIMLVNLRGVKESGTAFAIPTYFFLLVIFITVIIGFIRYLTGSLGLVVDPPALGVGIVQPITLFLILRSFANGTSSLTGVEAISNGIPAFKEPRSKNAGITLVWMAGILGVLLLGITFLATHIGALPAESETVISQLARTIYGGRGILYIAIISATTIILVMAANTAFADFPRLGALTAADGFLPRQLAYRGSRLVYSRGIAALAIIASLLVIGFKASVTGLIPLYAIGVFLSFTLSQAGMARRWWKAGHLKPGTEVREPGSTLIHDEGWQHKMVINGIGSISTCVVAVVFAATKFKDGAWIVIVLIPALIMVFIAIHRHYKRLAGQLSLDNYTPLGRPERVRVIMPISGVHRGTLQALRYARQLSDDITAVHISIDVKDTARVQDKWEHWGDGIRLVILDSPYRLFLEPLLEYIDKVDAARQPDEVITIIVPQFIPKHWWATFLHTRTAEALRRVLLNRKNIVVTEVPYQVE
ncbi:MAG: APC family permease [Chloroflexi bacterium]|nr:APC family permease [Chloroflexota bacterium]